MQDRVEADRRAAPIKAFGVGLFVANFVVDRPPEQIAKLRKAARAAAYIFDIGWILSNTDGEIDGAAACEG